ncbi:uncharacterized protein FIESC28_01608 [Fusarium coffeatum]|uniref:Neutral protease 2 n=1 Tax=Fusarium coffeatum TaxID=231269 RepID=A0A366SAJ6_9HYPO|nr:uncharacterized protein FIESC28_01608 [Fusarium coffeatum]RBR25645.1 hypothetical protein FIESC28_01608 [Fusarium coffeatum]
MKFFQVLTLVAQLTVGVQSHNPYRRAQESNDLSISLAQVPGKPSEVKATITNNGDSDLSLLKIGTILDERPVKKLTVTNENGDDVPFMGISLSIYYDGLKTKDYEHLAAGSSISRTVDLSVTHDLKPGTYSVFVDGSLPAVSGKDKKSTSIKIRSSPISVKISKASSAKAMQSKRAIVESEGCEADKLEANQNAVKNCVSLAKAAAADAADPQSARFVEYFKANDTESRNHVSGRLLAVAEECADSKSENTRVFCKDDAGYCESAGPLIAYTTWVNGYIVMCPLFYTWQGPLPTQCHKQDHASTMIHEMTHARTVYEQEVSTQDYAYGYENSTALDPLSCLYNADSYGLYASAVYLDC